MLFQIFSPPFFMHKNLNNYKIEPSKKTCKSGQINCNEFVEYISKYLKKVDKDTFSVLTPSKYLQPDVYHPDLLYHLILGCNDRHVSESLKNTSSKMLCKQIEINNKRKKQILNIIKKKLKHILAFEMIREIDSEIESIMMRRKKALKKKKKDEEAVLLSALLERRKLIENDFNIDDVSDEYEEGEDIDVPGLIFE